MISDVYELLELAFEHVPDECPYYDEIEAALAARPQQEAGDGEALTAYAAARLILDRWWEKGTDVLAETNTAPLARIVMADLYATGHVVVPAARPPAPEPMVWDQSQRPNCATCHDNDPGCSVCHPAPEVDDLGPECASCNNCEAPQRFLQESAGCWNCGSDSLTLEPWFACYRELHRVDSGTAATEAAAFLDLIEPAPEVDEGPTERCRSCGANLRTEDYLRCPPCVQADRPFTPPPAPPVGAESDECTSCMGENAAACGHCGGTGSLPTPPPVGDREPGGPT